MLPGRLFGATGGGDVKLMAALGTLLGPQQIVVAFLVGAIAGGALALGHAWRRGRLGTTMSRTAQLVVDPAAAKAAIDAAAPRHAIRLRSRARDRGRVRNDVALRG